MTGIAKLTAVVAVGLVCALGASAAAPQRASAAGLGPVCTVAGLFSGLAGKACGAVSNGGRLLGAGKKLLGGHIGGAAKTLLGAAGSKAGTVLGLAAIGAWVLGGAKVAMTEAAKLIDHSTSPQLKSSWFSASYWRMAGIAAVLTLPFLFAAAIQAMLRSDLALLARAALGYLPLAVLAVSIAAPVTMLLLAASDEMSSIISSAAGGDGVRALAVTGAKIGMISAFEGSPFLAFLIGLFIAAGAFVLWLELLLRQAAVYVVVLMLPLAFAAMVWPARRVWAVRAVELLVALILSKFAIVAVLSLAAAAMGHGALTGGSAMLTGLVLVTLAAFAPWVVVRMLPMAEVASAAAGSLRGELSGTGRHFDRVAGLAGGVAGLLDRPAGDEVDGILTGGEGARAETERMAEMTSAPVATGGAGDGGRAGDGRADGDDEPPLPGGSSGTPLAPSGPGGAAGSGGASGDGGDSGDGGSGGSGGGGGEVAGDEPSERIPGFPDLWQRGDMTWRPLTLGLDDGWPPPPLDPDDPGSVDETPEPPEGREGGHGAEDHNPLPPDQESEEGPL